MKTYVFFRHFHCTKIQLLFKPAILSSNYFPFSTLVGCLAFGTAFSAVAQVSNFPVSNAYGQVTPCATGLTYRSFGTKSNATLGSEVNKIEADKWYQLRVGEEKNQVLIQERDFKTGEVTLRIVDANKAPLNYSLWQIS